MANQILQQLQQNNIMMQAIGAMLRGETPQQFLQNLAKTKPELNGLDLSNPEKTAEQLYREKGEDITAAKADIQSQVGQFISK